MIVGLLYAAAALLVGVYMVAALLRPGQILSRRTRTSRNGRARLG